MDDAEGIAESFCYHRKGITRSLHQVSEDENMIIRKCMIDLDVTCRRCIVKRVAFVAD